MPRKFQNLQRNSKNSGSNKIGYACPSIMVVTKSDEEVNVTYYSTHIGHDADVGHLRLSCDERSKFAGIFSFFLYHITNSIEVSD